MTEITVTSKKPIHAVDITGRILSSLQPGEEGLLYLFSPHSTVALFISEFEPKLARDIESTALRLLEGCGPFEHDDNDNPNAPAHFISGLAGVGVTVPCRKGSLLLGKYQKIVLLELDGPKKRKVQLYRIGERDD